MYRNYFEIFCGAGEISQFQFGVYTALVERTWTLSQYTVVRCVYRGPMLSSGLHAHLHGTYNSCKHTHTHNNK